MADRDNDILARIAPGVGSIDADAWDRVAGSSDPFVSHAFLTALEVSQSVGGASGWTAAPIVIDDAEGAPAALLPAYLKSHSQGEYVFDHGWAEAWQRAGGRYYPKLQIAVPFTPVPGPRLLGCKPGQLIAAAETVTVHNRLSSAHATFLNEKDCAEFGQRGWLARTGIQYHWKSRGYSSFDDFLSALSSRKRKAIRKERGAARAGLEFRALRGAEIQSVDWDAFWAFYQDTGARKWGRPYLTRSFFDLVGKAMGENVLLFLAYRNGRPIAGALNFVGVDVLYGRYWGAVEEVPFLHFELCYYQAIEWAIANGLAYVQAGAQGEHKLSRGYEPVLTRSAHFIPDPGFRAAVAEFLEAERAAVDQEIAWLRGALPYRSSSP